jgi:fumarate hydratase, class II
MTTTQGRTRVERDTMGEMAVPADARYGASTMRAVLNFPISELRFPRQFIRALGLIKRAAAESNMELGLLDRERGEAIAQAAGEVAEGAFDADFPLDIFQTGSGTSTNMNANEVIAHRANELLGGKRVHPNDDVNMGQSSNDVIPTAIHLAALLSIHEDLMPALGELAASLERKATEFWPVIKTGRTHLQDATPIRLGQEFEGFKGQVDRAIERARTATFELSELALGGTAVGTGVNRPDEFPGMVIGRLAQATRIAVRETTNHFQAQCTLDNAVAASAQLRTIAISLMEIANNIRWMGSGPRAGIGEIAVPSVQPGSSIMPGKVNPVIAESVCMVAAQVIGNDATVALGGLAGSNFELNTMMPVVAYNLLQSIALLATSARNFAHQCIDGLEATSKGPDSVERGLMLATALAPAIGYEQAAAIAKTAAASGSTIREAAREQTDLSEEELDRLLDPAAMTEPGNTAGGGGG